MATRLIVVSKNQWGFSPAREAPHRRDRRKVQDDQGLLMRQGLDKGKNGLMTDRNVLVVSIDLQRDT